MAKRRRPNFFRLDDPLWREEVAFRLGFPILGVVVAVTVGWLITQL